MSCLLPDLLRLGHLTRWLHLPEATVLACLESGELSGVQFGGVWLVTREAVQRFLTPPLPAALEPEQPVSVPTAPVECSLPATPLEQATDVSMSAQVKLSNGSFPPTVIPGRP